MRRRSQFRRPPLLQGMAIAVLTQQSGGGGPVGCVFQLDGDATLPTAFGYDWAPSIAPGHQSATRLLDGAAVGGTALTMPPDPFGVDCFDIPAADPVAFEYQLSAFHDQEGVSSAGPALVWNVGGAFAGASSIQVQREAGGLTRITGSEIAAAIDIAGEPTDLRLGIYVNADGTVGLVTKMGAAASVDQGLTALVLPGGSKFAPYLFINDSDAGAAGQTTTHALYTDSADLACSYAVGTTNLCGNAI